MRQYDPNTAWDCPKCGSSKVLLMRYVEEETTLRITGEKVSDVLFVHCGTCSHVEIMKPVDATANDHR